MAIAHDATTDLGIGTGTLSATHTPVGVPSSVVVTVTEIVTAADNVSGVTYGGVALTKIAGGGHTTGEAVSVSIWHLGSGIPTGAQTVSVTVSGATTKSATCATATAGADTQKAGTEGTNLAFIQNPAASTTGVTGNAMGYAAFSTGWGGLTTTDTGWTQDKGTDHGSYVTHHWHETVEASGNKTYTVAGMGNTDECALVVVAIEEVASAGGSAGNNILTEAGDALLAENGSFLVTEDSPGGVPLRSFPSSNILRGFPNSSLRRFPVS